MLERFRIVKQIKEGTVDFGASDAAMSDAQVAAFYDKQGERILHFPTAISAIVPICNIPSGCASLNFTQQMLAGIYLGQITKWNDREIIADNRNVKLPERDIVVVHRSDGSETTYIWTEYLSKISGEWKDRAGKGASVSWPIGQGGKGDEGQWIGQPNPLLDRICQPRVRHGQSHPLCRGAEFFRSGGKGRFQHSDRGGRQFVRGHP